MIYDNTDTNSLLQVCIKIVKLIPRSGIIYFNKKEFQSPQCDYNFSFRLLLIFKRLHHVVIEFANEVNIHL